MAELLRISPRWTGKPCIVAAPGPSLTVPVARACRVARLGNGWKILAVQDAYRILPHADALYGCDSGWWRFHKDCDGFAGEKWTTHKPESSDKLRVDPTLGRSLADAFGLNVVMGEDGDRFSLDPTVIYYGSNSGFQAISLAILFGCKKIVLVGFDMRFVGGRSHFFGDHQLPIRQSDDETYRRFVPHFERAAKRLPADIEIINATPGSALKCFPMMPLEEALASAHGYAAAV